MSSYFAKELKKLSIPEAKFDENTSLRECQIGAYWSIKAHFTANENPAIVSLPTGAGKTALMMLLSFGLRSKRVLVIEPSKVLRNQTTRKFKKLEGLRIANVVGNEINSPSVEKIETRITSEEKWETVKDNDVVVALPHNISKVYDSRKDHFEDIVTPPSDLFDLVLIDEAHHGRAESWKQIIENYFTHSRIVLLTATPFRRDNKRLQGKLVYYYPLAKAISEGIYEPVKFEPVSVNSPYDRDKTLRQKAINKFDKIKDNAENPVILVRTDKIAKAYTLKKMYEKSDIKVEAVHSDNTASQNDKYLRKLREGELDAIVAVGMLCEGLDIENLKVAVFHEPPKSFPLTVQLVGRISRSSKGSRGAYVVADPAQMRQEGVAEKVKELYQEDTAWKKLIPKMIDEFVETEMTDISSLEGERKKLVGIHPDDIKPFLSTNVYRLHKDEFDFKSDFDLGRDIGVFKTII